MLPPADRDLHLRQNIPIGAGAVLKVADCQKLHHGRKQATETVVGSHRLPYRCPPEHASRSLAGIHGQVCPGLELHKGVFLEKLVEGSKGFKRGCAVAESTAAVTGGKKQTTLHTQDGSRLETGIELPLQAQGDVAHS